MLRVLLPLAFCRKRKEKKNGHTRPQQETGGTQQQPNRTQQNTHKKTNTPPNEHRPKRRNKTETKQNPNPTKNSLESRSPV